VTGEGRGDEELRYLTADDVIGLHADILRLNGWDVSATQRERADWILSLSAGTTLEQLARRLRAALVRLPFGTPG
jgi:prophage maintenance system killer protein